MKRERGADKEREKKVAEIAANLPPGPTLFRGWVGNAPTEKWITVEDPEDEEEGLEIPERKVQAVYYRGPKKESIRQWLLQLDALQKEYPELQQSLHDHYVKWLKTQEVAPYQKHLQTPKVFDFEYEANHPRTRGATVTKDELAQYGSHDLTPADRRHLDRWVPPEIRPRIEATMYNPDLANPFVQYPGRHQRVPPNSLQGTWEPLDASMREVNYFPDDPTQPQQTLNRAWWDPIQKL